MATLLIPVDGSSYSDRAVAYAIQRARNTPSGATLHLLNVQTPLVSINVKLFVSPESLQSHYREEGEKALAGALSAVRAAGLAATPHIGVGEAAQIIIDYARDIRADEIVMGTHGRGMLAGSLMGSVAQKVVHLAQVPVVLVR